jgi:hypothetical protein
MWQKSGVDGRIAPDPVMNCQLPATAGAPDRSGCRTMLGLNKADASNEYS